MVAFFFPKRMILKHSTKFVKETGIGPMGTDIGAKMHVTAVINAMTVIE